MLKVLMKIFEVASGLLTGLVIDSADCATHVIMRFLPKRRKRKYQMEMSRNFSPKVVMLLFTKITPKSFTVHHAQELARFVVRLMAWLSLVFCPMGRVVTFLSIRKLKALGLKGRSKPYVTEDELKLILQGAKLSGPINEEEQVASTSTRASPRSIELCGLHLEVLHLWC